MPTNYFERQTSARRSTGWLLMMFILATIAVVVTITVVVAVGLAASQDGGPQALTASNYPWPIPIMAGLATLVLILGGSFYKVLQLRAGGGRLVAESQGGVLIYPDTTDPIQRRVLNVVEEMAIAAGTPVPPVYFLPNEPGINAFAAGYSPSDAVMAVTRGATEELTRDELQGVVAHEFSHILNADMKIGIRVMGILFGVMLLGLVGQMVLRWSYYSSMLGGRRDSKSGGAVMAIYLVAIAAVILGFVGTFFGNLIKAAIMRQRERLADASGVQFTRNPAGLAGALKRIGALEQGSHLNSPNAAEASHLFFAEGVWKVFSGLYSTHPPLEERIRELDPGWDGIYPPPHAAARTIAGELRSTPAPTNFNRAAFIAGSAAGSAIGPDGGESGLGFANSQQRELPIQVVKSATDHIGNPTDQHCNYAATVVDQAHDTLVAAAREPYSARALVFCLLLHQEPPIRAKQLASLSAIIESNLARIVQQLIPLVDQADTRARLPLIDMALPALATMTASQYNQFSTAFNALVQADGQLDLFEWMLAQVIRRNLQARFERVRPTSGQLHLSRFPEQCATVFSAVAYAGGSDTADQAFAAAEKIVPELSNNLLSRDACNLNNLQSALTDLANASTSERIRLIQGCAAAISADQHATIEEVELLRGISDLLGCPMPPLLAT